MGLSWASRDIKAGPLKEKQRRRGRHGGRDGERRGQEGPGEAHGFPQSVQPLRAWPDTEHARHHTGVCVCEPGVWSVCVSVCSMYSVRVCVCMCSGCGMCVRVCVCVCVVCVVHVCVG